jgi:hypothetical protein
LGKVRKADRALSLPAVEIHRAGLRWVEKRRCEIEIRSVKQNLTQTQNGEAQKKLGEKLEALEKELCSHQEVSAQPGQWILEAKDKPYNIKAAQ